MKMLPRSDWTSTRDNRHTPLSRTATTSITVHYPASGNRTHAGESKAKTAQWLEGWRKLHVNGHGWADIGYNYAVDQAGRVWFLTGNDRGAHAGTNAGNSTSVGVLFIVGNNEKPTEKAINAFRELRAHLLKSLPNATRVRGHKDWKSTACPGPHLYALVKSGELAKAPKKDTAPADPTPADGSYRVKRGDTLGQIAARFGVTVSQLAKWNSLADPNTIITGQVLRVVEPVADSKPLPARPEPLAFWLTLWNVTGDRYSDGKTLGGGWPKRASKVAKHHHGLKGSLRVVNEVTSSRMTRDLQAPQGSNMVHDGSAYGNDFWRDKRKFSVGISRTVNIGKTGRSFEFAELKREGKTFNLIIVHLPARNPAGRASDMQFVLNYVKNFNDPTIIAGDFNNWSEYALSPRARLRSAGFKASRDQTKQVVRGDTDEMDATKKVVTRNGAGRWVSDVYTKGCNVDRIELVLNPTSTYSTHHAFKARIVID